MLVVTPSGQAWPAAGGDDNGETPVLAGLTYPQVYCKRRLE